MHVCWDSPGDNPVPATNFLCMGRKEGDSPVGRGLGREMPRPPHTLGCQEQGNEESQEGQGPQWGYLLQG